LSDHGSFSSSRPDCYFAHPQGRRIDQAGGAPAVPRGLVHAQPAVPAIPTPADAVGPGVPAPMQPKLNFAAPGYHPGGPIPTGTIVPPGGVGYGAPIPPQVPAVADGVYPPGMYPPCAPGMVPHGYGGGYRPWGDSYDGPDDCDYYEEDDEEARCPCCHGYPSTCKNPGCDRRGHCACLVGLTEEEKEAELDRENMRILDDQMAQKHAAAAGTASLAGAESKFDSGLDSMPAFDAEDYYPMSRKCECCQGFPYRCAIKLPGCVSNAPPNRVCNGTAQTVCVCRN